MNFLLTTCVASGPALPEDGPSMDQPQFWLPGAAERMAGGGGSWGREGREELEAGGAQSGHRGCLVVGGDRRAFDIYLTYLMFIEILQ